MSEPQALHYYDLKKHWRKVKPHLSHPDLQAQLVEDFNKYTMGRWRKPFAHYGGLPKDVDSCDWRCDRRGRPPAFWDYACHGACHWLVNFELGLAYLVEPHRRWRIVTADKHSTVWDGETTLFDFNFLAMGIPPQECFDLAYETELYPGELRPTSDDVGD